MQEDRIIESEKVSEMSAGRKLVVALKLIDRIGQVEGFETVPVGIISYLMDIKYLVGGITLGDLTN